MKVRTGFVSNSSSSSFVIRGLKLKKDYVATCVGVKPEDCNFSDPTELYEAIWCKLYNKKSGAGKIAFEDTSNFFTDDISDTMIVGVELVSLDDGQVYQIPEPDDEKIRSKISKVLGRDVKEKLHTYIQYISNDNF